MVSQQTLGVVLAEEQPFMRDAMERELQSRPEFELIAVTGGLTHDQLVDLSSAENEAVYLVGCATLSRALASDLERLAVSRPSCGIAIVCGDVEDDALGLVQRISVAARQGFGLLFRSSLYSGDDVEQLLKAVGAGRVVLDRQVMQQLVTPSTNQGATDRLSALTPPENEALSLMSKGLNNAGIAAAMNVRRNTADRHIYNIYQKLKGRPDGVQPRAYATSLLRQAG